HRKEFGFEILKNARAVVRSLAPVTDADVARFDLKAHEAGVQLGMPSKPSEAPWNPTGLMDDRGNHIEPLRDDQIITEDLALNPRQAAKQLGNFRQWQEAAQNELAAKLQEQNAIAEIQEAAKEAQEIQRQRQQQAIQQQQARPQVDPLAAQKFQLAHQAA